MTLLRALKDWRATYDPALSVRAKDPVQIGHEDPDYPGWVWCVDQSGLGGWLPKEILGKLARPAISTPVSFRFRQVRS